MRLLVVLACFLIASTAHAEVRLWTRLYDGGSTVAAYPQHFRPQPVRSLFGGELSSPTWNRLSAAVSMETRMREHYHWLCSVSYTATARLSLAPGTTLSIEHGSWHTIDHYGPTEFFNSLELEGRWGGR